MLTQTHFHLITILDLKPPIIVMKNEYSAHYKINVKRTYSMGGSPGELIEELVT